MLLIFTFLKCVMFLFDHEKSYKTKSHSTGVLYNSVTVSQLPETAPL